MKIIDLSLPTEESPSEPTGVSITYLGHEDGAGFLSPFFRCEPAEPARRVGLRR